MGLAITAKRTHVCLTMKSEVKQARFLHSDAREYHGQPRVLDYQVRARRVERRTLRQRLKHQQTVGELA